MNPVNDESRVSSESSVSSVSSESSESSVSSESSESSEQWIRCKFIVQVSKLLPVMVSVETWNPNGS